MGARGRTYNVGDVLEGKVTKVVSFGAFVEIMEGVEGLVHISELAQHHVENPREVVEPGDKVKVKILEIDEERRRLSLSLKRVEGQVLEPKVAAGADGRRGGRRRAGPRPARRRSSRRTAPASDGPEPSRAEAAAEVAAEPAEEPEAEAEAERACGGGRARRGGPAEPGRARPSPRPTRNRPRACCSSA